MEAFELNTQIEGMNAMEYMANLIEKNERQAIEIERGKLSVAVLKQMNNRSRLLLDAEKFKLKQLESTMRNEIAAEDAERDKDTSHIKLCKAWASFCKTIEDDDKALASRLKGLHVTMIAQNKFIVYPVTQPLESILESMRVRIERFIGSDMNVRDMEMIFEH